MNVGFLIELIEFSLSRKVLFKRMLFLLYSFIFFRVLAREFGISSDDDDSVMNHAGDDIYPLF